MIVISLLFLILTGGSITFMVIENTNIRNKEIFMLRRREIELRKELELQQQNNLQEQKIIELFEESRLR